MKNYIFLLLLACLSSCTNEYYTEDITENKEGHEYIITKYGAIGDGENDCSTIINKLIEDLPPSGGVIVIPEGDFVLDSPIIVNKSFVTIRGLNTGMRSNIDVVDIHKLLGPGGGSKLILRRANTAILIPIMPNLGGLKNRISGVEIKDLMISGGASNNGIGIDVKYDNDRCRISNLIGINLNYGIRVKSADAMMIQDSWICEVQNSIEMTDGIQNMISNCQLGAQPSGITCKLVNQTNFLFTNNHIYPDGSKNLVLDNCEKINVTNNNFKSYYVGMLDINGNHNLVNGNIFWLADIFKNQFMGYNEDYGVIRVAGNFNMLSSNIVVCNWNNLSIDPVTVYSLAGKGNSFANLLIENQNSTRVFLVNESAKIYNCVPVDKIKIERDENVDLE